MKTCPCCNREQQLSNFHRNRASRDGLRCYCKACHNAQNRKWRKDNPKESYLSTKRWREGNKHKQRAHQAARSAVRRGDLSRPGYCEGCGCSCSPDAHHDDHSQPLVVSWLCRTCHKRVERVTTEGV